MLPELQAILAQRDQMIAQLHERLSAMELQTGNNAANSNDQKRSSSKTNLKVANNKKKPTKTAGKKKAKDSPAAGPKSTPKSHSNLSPQKKTPVKQHARSATPLSASKKSPLQMIKKEHPAGFEHTKVSF